MARRLGSHFIDILCGRRETFFSALSSKLFLHIGMFFPVLSKPCILFKSEEILHERHLKQVTFQWGHQQVFYWNNCQPTESILKSYDVIFSTGVHQCSTNASKSCLQRFCTWIETWTSCKSKWVHQLYRKISIFSIRSQWIIAVSSR